MIKDLIKDLAYDNIQLSQGLTRAKLIASKLNNETLKMWLQKEIEGYDYNDNSLPRYRVIPSALFLTINLPFNNRHTFPVSFDEAPDDDLKEHLQNHRVTEPISLVETTASLNGQALSLPLSPDELAQFGNLFASQINAMNGKIVSGHFQVGRSHYQYIVDVTKQKLLDILLELDNEFPNLENVFVQTSESANAVQNIINNYIYGDGNFVDVATGQSVIQINTKRNGSTNT